MPTRLLLAITFAIGFSPFGGCPNDPANDTSGSGSPAAMSTIQRQMPVSEFEALVNSDADLQSTVSFAQFAFGAGQAIDAGIVGEPDGPQITWIAYASNGDPVVVARHCGAGDCVSGVVLMNSSDGDVSWYGPRGPLTIRQVPEPFLMRLYTDESDPDGSADIAPYDFASLAARVRSTPTLLSGAKTRLAAADRERAFHVTSAFGSFFSLEGSSFSDLLADMSDAGFTTTQLHKHAGPADVDGYLRSLGPDDVLVIYGHGDVSQSRGRATGMSLNSYYIGSQHYPAERAAQMLAANPNGGPGIVFLAGCQTGDLVNDLDDANQIIIGFSKPHFATNIRSATRAFFDTYTAGGTLGEAIEKVNQLGIMSSHDVALITNHQANLSRTFADQPDASPDSLEDPLPHIYRGTGFLDVTATADYGSRSTATLSQSVTIEVQIRAGNSATARISGTRALSPVCPSGSDPGGGVNEIAFNFSTDWRGTWTGTPTEGTVDLHFVDQSIDFVISCSFNGATITGHGEWNGTYGTPTCTTVTTTQRNVWDFRDVPRSFE